MTDSNHHACDHRACHEVLAPSGAASLLLVSENKLMSLRKTDPTFPAPKWLGDQPRWTRSRLLAWLNSTNDQNANDQNAHGRARTTAIENSQTDSTEDSAGRKKDKFCV